MREYDDDSSIQHYAPVLRRIIILVAVITAVPVMLWTITAFMHTYIAQPTIPAPRPLATATAPGPLYVPKLPASGFYTVVYAPSATGTVSTYVTTPQVAAANLTWGNFTSPTPSIYYWDSNVYSSNTQQEYLTFSGALNQLTEVDVFQVTGTWTLSLINSAGTTLWTSSSFNSTTALTLPPLPADDSYILAFDPGTSGGGFSYNAGIVASASLSLGSTLTISGGGPNPVGLGPTARVAFSGTAGEALTLSVGATRGSVYGYGVWYLQGNSQVCLFACSNQFGGGSWDTSFVSLPVTGTYIVYLYFATAFPAAANVRLSSAIPLTIGAASSVSFGLSASTGLYTDVIKFSSGNQSVTFHDTCSHDLALLNSSGTVLKTYSYSGQLPGSAALGSLGSGSYSLVITQPGGTSSTTVGSTPSTFSAEVGTVAGGGGGGGNSWPTTTSTCTFQLTSP